MHLDNSGLQQKFDFGVARAELVVSCGIFSHKFLCPLTVYTILIDNNFFLNSLKAIDNQSYRHLEDDNKQRNLTTLRHSHLWLKI